MIEYASKSYQMAGEMYKFAIYAKNPDFTVIGLISKPCQLLVSKKEAPILREKLGTILHRAIVTPLSEVLIPNL